jgi:hypothetical protein
MVNSKESGIDEAEYLVTAQQSKPDEADEPARITANTCLQTSARSIVDDSLPDLRNRFANAMSTPTRANSPQRSQCSDATSVVVTDGRRSRLESNDHDTYRNHTLDESYTRRSRTIDKPVSALDPPAENTTEVGNRQDDERGYDADNEASQSSQFSERYLHRAYTRPGIPLHVTWCIDPATCRGECQSKPKSPARWSLPIVWR